MFLVIRAFTFSASCSAGVREAGRQNWGLENILEKVFFSIRTLKIADDRVLMYDMYVFFFCISEKTAEVIILDYNKMLFRCLILPLESLDILLHTL